MHQASTGSTVQWYVWLKMVQTSQSASEVTDGRRGDTDEVAEDIDNLPTFERVMEAMERSYHDTSKNDEFHGLSRIK